MVFVGGAGLLPGPAAEDPGDLDVALTCSTGRGGGSPRPTLASSPISELWQVTHGASCECRLVFHEPRGACAQALLQPAPAWEP